MGEPFGAIGYATEVREGSEGIIDEKKVDNQQQYLFWSWRGGRGIYSQVERQESEIQNAYCCIFFARPVMTALRFVLFLFWGGGRRAVFSFFVACTRRLG